MNNIITIRKNEATATGYELVNGDGTILAIESTYKNEPFTLVLPKNTANRSYCNSKKVDAAPNQELILNYKEAVHRGPSIEKKALVEYLSEDDRALYEELIAKAKANREIEIEMAKAAQNDPLEKARKEMEKWQRKVQELQAKQLEEPLGDIE